MEIVDVPDLVAEVRDYSDLVNVNLQQVYNLVSEEDKEAIATVIESMSLKDRTKLELSGFKVSCKSEVLTDILNVTDLREITGQ